MATFYIDNFDIVNTLDVSGIPTGIDDVSINLYSGVSFDVAVDCSLSTSDIKNTFFVLADSNVEIDGDQPTNTSDLSYVFDPSAAATLVNNLFDNQHNSTREFRTANDAAVGYSDSLGPEGTCSPTGYAQTKTSQRFGSGQIQDDFMRHLSYRLFNVPTAADVLENSITLSNNFREKFLESFGKAIVSQSASSPTTDVSYTFNFVNGGGSSTVTGAVESGAVEQIDFTTGGAVAQYLVSSASEKLWDKLVTYSRDSDVAGNGDARWSDISGNSTLGTCVVNGNPVDRTRIQMMLQAGDVLVFTLQVNFANGQLAATGMTGRRTTRVYKIRATLI